jgi:hypothetical protein
MSITTKVKKTGRLFQATTDLGRDKTLHQEATGKIQPDTIYQGHLLNAYDYSRRSQLVEYSRTEWGVFRGYELEEFQADLSLVRAK